MILFEFLTMGPVIVTAPFLTVQMKGKIIPCHGKDTGSNPVMVVLTR